MHKIKAAARHSAWYNTEGDPPNYNPFRKIDSRTTISPEAQLENGQARGIGPLVRKGTYYSDHMSPTEPSTEPIHPKHSASMPNASMTEGNQISSTMPTSVEEPDRKELSEDSGAATSDTAVGTTPPTTENDGPRQRKTGKLGGILGKFHHKDDEKSTDDIERSDTKSSRKPPKFTFRNQIQATILNSWINVLIIAAPVGIALYYAHAQPVAIFVVNFIAIIPLAAMLSYATEEIALRVGETLGGLLNATFGNAVELIVSIIALIQGQILIVQTSLIGSMLSNLLLVMGMCFFFGGLNRVEQHFNITVAQTAASLLALAIASLIIPTAFLNYAAGAQSDDNKSKDNQLSRGVAILLLLVYGCYLFFQLKTHIDIYNEPSQKVAKRRVKVEEGDMNRQLASMGANASAMAGEDAQASPHEDEEREEPRLHIWVAIATLGISTVIIALCAEYLVDSINALTETGGISKTFVGLILLPIVGNAAEHATAVTVACKDKMDLAIGVAVGSSMQIALLVLPLSVVIGWIINDPVNVMNLDFDGFQITILFVAVLLVNYLISDGKSHWLEGVLLMTLYLIIAIAAWFYPAATAPGQSAA
ncbi:hypothetical protein MMC25_005010 [Agyrium rufum]|nr:hypothetical protein [Agyrium rufum]